MAAPVVSFDHVCLRYHSAAEESLALEDLSFQVEPGEFLVILGPSGCGKSTILSLIAGLLSPSEGTIRINGIEQSGAVKSEIGYMFQHDHLFPWASLRENLLLGLKVRGELSPPKKSRVDDMLRQYGLLEFANRSPRALSGGMRQRAALIRTLATEPEILLLDEPFSALDYQTRILVSEDIASIIKQEGKTAIMVTHDISEALSLADRILVLSPRPARVSLELPIDILGKGVILRRASPKFSEYFNLIWKELDSCEG